MHLENEAWVVASYNGEAENTQTVAFPLTTTMAHLVTLLDALFPAELFLYVILTSLFGEEEK